MDLLCVLSARRDCVVAKEALIRKVWGDKIVGDEVLTVAVYELRKAFRDRARGSRFIETVRGRGYRWVGPAPTQEPDPQPADPQPADPRPGATASDVVRRSGRMVWRRWLVVALAASLIVVVALGIRRPPDAPLPVAGVRLAVLPLSGPAGADAGDLAEVLTGSLINGLARDGHRVTAHSSVRRYRDSRQPLAEIADQLGVDVLLEGVLHAVGSGVTIEVQLIDPASGRVRWAGQERASGDAIAQLGDRIARSAKIALGGTRPGRIGEAPTPVDPVAFADYVAARMAHLRGDWVAAEQGYRRAGERDLRFAEPWLAMASLFADQMEVDSMRAQRSLEVVAESAKRAVAAAPASVEADVWFGFVALFRDWDLVRAEQLFHRAVERSPALAVAHRHLAAVYSLRGEPDRAIQSARVVVALDPNNPWSHLTLAWMQVFAGRFESALESLEAAPGAVLGHHEDGLAGVRVVRRMALEALGRNDEARLVAIETLESLGLGSADLKTPADPRDFYRACLEHAEASLTPVGSAYFLGQVGEIEAALDLIEAAIERRDPESLWVALVPLSQPLRHLPRFRSLLARLPT